MGIIERKEYFKKWTEQGAKRMGQRKHPTPLYILYTENNEDRRISRENPNEKENDKKEDGHSVCLNRYTRVKGRMEDGTVVSGNRQLNGTIQLRPGKLM